MFFVNCWKETERGTFVCVSSRPFYNLEEAEALAYSLSRVSKDVDYTVDDLNQKGQEVEAL